MAAETLVRTISKTLFIRFLFRFRFENMRQMARDLFDAGDRIALEAGRGASIRRSPICTGGGSIRRTGGGSPGDSRRSLCRNSGMGPYSVPPFTDGASLRPYGSRQDKHLAVIRKAFPGFPPAGTGRPMVSRCRFSGWMRRPRFRQARLGAIAAHSASCLKKDFRPLF